MRIWGAHLGMSTTAGHCVSGSDGAAAAGARFGAQPGTTGFTGSGAFSGSGLAGASAGVVGINVLRDEVHGVVGFFTGCGGSGEAASGSDFVDSAAAGGTVLVDSAGGTVVVDSAAAGGTVLVGSAAAGGTVLVDSAAAGVFGSF